MHKFVLLIDSKDLEQLGAQDAEFTVFVPTDAAFKVRRLYYAHFEDILGIFKIPCRFCPSPLSLFKSEFEFFDVRCMSVFLSSDNRHK